MNVASLPSKRLLLEVLVENQSDAVLCVVGLFYEHKDEAFCNQAGRAGPTCSSLLMRSCGPCRGSALSLQPDSRRQKTQKRGLAGISVITFYRELPAAFFKILWPQMLVSALDFDGKLEGKNLVSSFEF